MKEASLTQVYMQENMAFGECEVPEASFGAAVKNETSSGVFDSRRPLESQWMVSILVMVILSLYMK